MIPSVTQVISPYVDYSKVPPHLLNYASERGTMFHSYAKLYAEGKWVVPRQDLKLRFLSFRKWFDENVVGVLCVEQELKCTCYDYIGHVDLIALLKWDRSCTLLDYKTPVQAKKSWEAQVAGGYWHLVKKHLELRETIHRCGAIMIDPKGGPAKMIEYSGSTQRAFAGYLNALMAWRYFNDE